MVLRSLALDCKLNGKWEVNMTRFLLHEMNTSLLRKLPATGHEARMKMSKGDDNDNKAV